MTELMVLNEERMCSYGRVNFEKYDISIVDENGDSVPYGFQWPTSENIVTDVCNSCPSIR